MPARPISTALNANFFQVFGFHVSGRQLRPVILRGFPFHPSVEEV